MCAEAEVLTIWLPPIFENLRRLIASHHSLACETSYAASNRQAIRKADTIDPAF
jgi:hypothetical protein